jgi:RNA polymerase sigma-70 factor (ECF subfamily)
MTVQDSVSDGELLAQYRAGSTQAAEELLGRYASSVYAWCRRFARDHDDALDLAQDVLLSGFEALGSFRGEAPFGAWLFTITRRACIRNARRAELRFDPEVEPDQLVDPSPDATELVHADRLSEKLQTIMQQHLSSDEQQALVLRYEMGLSVDEITRLLGLDAQSGARGALQQARRKLRRALAELGDST